MKYHHLLLRIKVILLQVIMSGTGARATLLTSFTSAGVTFGE